MELAFDTLCVTCITLFDAEALHEIQSKSDRRFEEGHPRTHLSWRGLTLSGEGGCHFCSLMVEAAYPKTLYHFSPANLNEPVSVCFSKDRASISWGVNEGVIHFNSTVCEHCF